MRVSFRVEAGNAAAEIEGVKAVPTILEREKPEAAYLSGEGARWTGVLVIDTKDTSDLPRIVEPWLLTRNGSIEVTSVMVPEDLQTATSAIEQAVGAAG